MIFGLNFTFLSKYWFYYMDGLKVTLQLAFWTLILSSIVGVIMGMIRVQNYKIISTIIDWWINFIRGVPIMVQIFIVYYGIATSLPQFWAAVVSLTVNSSVYIAEHTRAGMQAVNKGQMEAARCIGMSKLQANFYIIIPQAIKNVLPSLCNEFILLIKNTSIVSVIAQGREYIFIKILVLLYGRLKSNASAGILDFDPFQYSWCDHGHDPCAEL